jgi:hypothetical protein
MAFFPVQFLCLLLWAFSLSHAGASSCESANVNVTVLKGSGNAIDVYWGVKKKGETHDQFYGSVGSKEICLAGGVYTISGEAGGNTQGWQGANLSMVDVDDGTVYLSDWFGPGDENDKTTEVTIPCSVGKRWDSGSGECVACSAGKFGIGKGDCSYSVANCSAGYYCGGSGGAATKCPSGKYGNVTGKSVESEACLYSCGASTYGTAAGQTTASAACSPCPIGFFCSGGSNRVPCPAGKWGAVASQASEANACPNDCPSGKFAGQSSNSGNSALAAACPNECPNSTYGSGAAKVSRQEACTSCPSGTYGSLTGQSSEASACTTVCPRGSYCPGGGKVVFCPSGTYGNLSKASTELSGCPGKCQAGRYGAQYTLRVSGKCHNAFSTKQECGRVAVILGLSDTTAVFDGMSGSADYPTGCYLDDSELKFNGAGNNNGDCADGLKCLCDGSGGRTVEEACSGLCPVGKFGSATGKSSEAEACPSSCPAGKTGRNSTIGMLRSNESNACVCKSLACNNLCPAGRFGTGVLPMQTNGCPGCSSGKYTMAYEKKEFGSCSLQVQSLEECTRAAQFAGYSSHTAEDDNQHDKGHIPTGCYFLPGTNKLKFNGGKNNWGYCSSNAVCICNEEAKLVSSACPNVCSSGKYGTSKGQVSESSACPNGCPLGQTARRSKTGATTETAACVVCPSGKYGSSPGECSNCPKGLAFQGNAGKFCEECTGDKYANIAGMSRCKVCPEGKVAVTEEFDVIALRKQNLTVSGKALQTGCRDDLGYVTYLAIAAAALVCFCLFCFCKSQQGKDVSTRLRDSFGGTMEMTKHVAGADNFSAVGIVSTEDLRVRSRTTENRVNKLSGNIRRLKQWKEVKINFVASTNENDLVVSLDALLDFFLQHPDFRVKHEELDKMKGQKVTTLNLHSVASDGLNHWSGAVESKWRQVIGNACVLA